MSLWPCLTMSQQNLSFHTMKKNKLIEFPSLFYSHITSRPFMVPLDARPLKQYGNLLSFVLVV